MISEMAMEDCAELTAQGVQLSAREIVRLNALGLKAECGESAASLFAMPRVCVLGDLMWREPTIGHQIWLEHVTRLFDDSDTLVCNAVYAYALTMEVDDLPSLGDINGIRKEIPKFIKKKLKRYTLRQIALCNQYVMIGDSDTFGESVDDAHPEDDEDVAQSIALGVINEGRALGLGISLADSKSMTVSEYQAVLKRAYMQKGADVAKDEKATAVGRYMKCLQAIKEHHGSRSTDKI